MGEHPRRIGTEYAGQFRRPEDSARENAEAERKAALGEHESAGDHEGLAAFNDAWEQVTGELGATVVDEAPVDQAIMEVAAQSGQAVEQAKLSKDERQAKALVDELERRGTVLGDTHFQNEEEGTEEAVRPADMGRYGYYPDGLPGDETREIGWYEVDGEPRYWDGSEWQEEADS